MNRKVLRNAPQMKLLLMLNDLRLRQKWPELKLGLKFLNQNLTRFYIDAYWKFTFLVNFSHDNLSHSVDKIPQFIDCLNALNIQNKNEVVYSIVYLLLGQNRFKEGIDLLQMYHLTSSTYEESKEKEINTLVGILNSNIEYVKWREQISSHESHKSSHNNDYEKQLAEKCCFQLELLVESLDLCDFQFKKLSEIYLHYNKLNELEELLEIYAKKQPDYLNAQKYLFEFELKHKNNLSMELFQRIARICPSDSFIVKYVNQFRDIVLSLDCLFDLLDYYQWKYYKEVWNNLNKLMLKCEKTDAVRQCIVENWSLRKSYWIPYHFKAFTSIYNAIDEHRLSIGVMLLGPSHVFVRQMLADRYKNLQLKMFTEEAEIHRWLFRD